MTILNLIFLICSIRTNVVFVLIFFAAAVGFGFGAGAFWQAANNNMLLSTQLAIGCGACFFAASVLNFYMLLAVMIPTMQLPLPNLPIFDLSTKITAKEDDKGME